MKKSAALLVTLALVSLSASSAFAQSPDPTTGAGASAPAKPKSKKPKKTHDAPRKVPAAAAAPEAPAAATTTTATTTSASLPADDGSAKSAPSSSASPAGPAPARDEAGASHQASDADAKPIALAPLVGYASQGLKLGFGARGSYTFSNHISVAATFVYHLGTSDDGSLDGVNASSSVHVFYPGAEGGYDFRFDRFTVRPYLGIAAVFVSASTTAGDRSSGDTSSHFGFYPGVNANYDLPVTGAALFAGADMRLMVVTDGGDPSFGFFGTFGIRL